MLTIISHGGRRRGGPRLSPLQQGKMLSIVRPVLGQLLPFHGILRTLLELCIQALRRNIVTSQTHIYTCSHNIYNKALRIRTNTKCTEPHLHTSILRENRVILLAVLST